MTDLDALTLTIWGEARGEPIEGQVGVAWVMRNRLLEHYLGAQNYVDICTAHAQFSAWTDEATQMGIEIARLSYADLQKAGAPPELKLAHEIAYATIAGTLTDNTNGSDHYYADTIPPPYWAKGAGVLAALGHHRFLKVA